MTSLSLALPVDVTAEQENDSLGGFILPADVYKGKLDMVYLDKSPNGAICINIHFNTGSHIVRNTVYISNRKGEFTYNAGKVAKPLPGYSQMDAFFKAVTGKGIAQQVSATKTIKIYNYDLRKEVPEEREVFVELIGTQAQVGILQVKEEKTNKVSVDPKNKPYTEGTGEFREFNELSKWFDEDGLTTAEKASGETSPEFLEKWRDKFSYKVTVRNAKVKAPSNAGITSGMPDIPSKSLFS